MHYIRVTEWLGLEGTLEPTHFQTPAMGRAATHQIRLPNAPSNLALNPSWDGASTASLSKVLYWVKIKDQYKGFYLLIF